MISEDVKKIEFIFLLYFKSIKMATEIKLCADDDPMGEILKNIHVYGSYDEPLFLAKDVETALGLKNLNYSNDESFTPNLHKTYVEVPTYRGVRQMVALTECGLYKAIFRSQAQNAERFQYYVYCVLKRLRIQGIVSREQAIADATDLYHAKNDLQILNSKVKNLELALAEAEFIQKPVIESISIYKKYTKPLYIVGPEYDEGDFRLTWTKPKTDYSEMLVPKDTKLEDLKVELKDTELYKVIDEIEYILNKN